MLGAFVLGGCAALDGHGPWMADVAEFERAPTAPLRVVPQRGGGGTRGHRLAGKEEGVPVRAGTPGVVQPGSPEGDRTAVVCGVRAYGPLRRWRTRRSRPRRTRPGSRAGRSRSPS
ncbi:DUF6357 family protein [Streptomyces filamentosus]|uniref:DUF6357 family protein n=1 Tax=Streptomyces filamentosus TaxID=67294 RepID=A0ABY4V4F6_STRFL|nr:DUF6357 family protein [Streptomyces filamentosus]USC51448.1 DUF6357 family protein [Streptomyces filamentosus]